MPQTHDLEKGQASNDSDTSSFTTLESAKSTPKQNMNSTSPAALAAQLNSTTSEGQYSLGLHEPRKPQGFIRRHWFVITLISIIVIGLAVSGTAIYVTHRQPVFITSDDQTRPDVESPTFSQLTATATL